MRPKIDPKRAAQFMSQACDKKQAIMREAGKKYTPAQKKEMARLNQIIADCEAVIRGDGGKKGK
jgi:hypothetical protein